MDGFDPSELPVFIHARAFALKWERLELTDDDLRVLETEIIEAAAAVDNRHPVVEGTGGVRKARFVPPREARGKRGAYRTIYLYLRIHGVVYLLTVYGKGEKGNLSKAERNEIASLVRSIKSFHEREGAR